MYYRGVNRGVSFTKSGRYTIGLVVLLGVIATGSGYNALYLSLSFGLGMLIVSGLQSEKLMASYRLIASRETTADAMTPFNFELRAKNTSKNFCVYGVENILVNDVPKFRLFSSEVRSPTVATVLALPAGKDVFFSGRSDGMARGYYSTLYAIQRTGYPFGLLTKFKVDPLKGVFCILPQRNTEAEERIREDIKKRFSYDRRDQQFYAHRTYLSGDSLRHVDWKKSAGLQTQFWSLKSYQSIGDETGVLVQPSIDSATSAVEYEQILSLSRSFLELSQELGRQVVLEFTAGVRAVGYREALQLLASAPTYGKKGFSYKPRPVESSANYLPVEIASNSWHWNVAADLEDVS